MTQLVLKTIYLPTQRTAMRLEPVFWEALDEIAEREVVSRAELIERASYGLQHGNRTSAVRSYVLSYFKEASTENGHLKVGHGERHPPNIPRRN